MNNDDRTGFLSEFCLLQRGYSSVGDENAEGTDVEIGRDAEVRDRDTGDLQIDAELGGASIAIQGQQIQHRGGDGEGSGGGAGGADDVDIGSLRGTDGHAADGEDTDDGVG